MLTTKRTTKASEISRSIKLATDEDGTYAVVTEINFQKTKCSSKSTLYRLRRLASQIGGVAVEVEKRGEDAEVYHVLLNAPGGGHCCDCKWGTYKANGKPCRHVETCLQACREQKI